MHLPWQPAVARTKLPFDSLHDSWLHALRSIDGVVEGDTADLAQLAVQVREWRRPIAVSASSPLRLCFRLEEPEDTARTEKDGEKASSDAWYVRYLLQPHDDPSLLIPVDEAWKARGRKISAIGQDGYGCGAGSLPGGRATKGGSDPHRQEAGLPALQDGGSAGPPTDGRTVSPSSLSTLRSSGWWTVRGRS